MKRFDFDKILYKYRDLEGLKRMINDKTIYLAPPATFNDPHEFNTSLLKFNVTDKFAQKMFKNDLKGFENVRGKTSKYERKQMLKKVNANIFTDSILTAFNQHKKDLFGIYCCSVLSDNYLMWSHYANNHKGFCIGIDFPQSFFFGDRYIAMYVDYVTEIRKINAIKDGVIIHDEAFLTLLSTKHERWKYEDEVRIMKLDGFGTKSFDPLWVTELYFGIHTPQGEVDIVTKLLAENGFQNIKLYKMNMSDSDFNVTPSIYFP